MYDIKSCNFTRFKVVILREKTCNITLFLWPFGTLLYNIVFTASKKKKGGVEL